MSTHVRSSMNQLTTLNQITQTEALLKCKQNCTRSDCFIMFAFFSKSLKDRLFLTFNVADSLLVRNSTLKDLMETVFDSHVVSEFLSLRTPMGFGELGHLFSGSWGALAIILGKLGSKQILLEF